ncbi:imidazolonepropionase [Oceanibaculum pacificum]|uniref:Imidazolonepropionase n=1 Tax=Oceanibaculum pacificum TaxID=580166 RepID=A0A154W7Q8_9PROT|nr:imidazolonepropionase [Oceanibaculum pacificum]KZD09493.1 imidazolonepropionase [Oceanibaculum pacificum]
MGWDALWTNVKLATMAEAGYGAIRDGAIAVADGRIAWIGQRGDLPAPLARTVRVLHDAGGLWLTPGLIDSHTHIVFAGNRAMDFEMRLNGADRAAIYAAGGGIPSTVLKTRAASFETLLAEALPRIDSLQAEGVTTVEIKSGYGLDMETELRQLRVARRIGETRPLSVVTSFLGTHGMPPGWAGTQDSYIDFVCAESLPEAVRQGLVDIVDGGLEKLAFDHAQMRRVWDVAQRLGKPIKAHTDQYSDAGGGKVVAEVGGLSADHLECVSRPSVDAMARAGTVATVLPGANYTLRDENKPPIGWFRELGVPMALSTNCNPGSSPTASPLLMMNMACTLFMMTPEEALAGFTRNAARALGLQDSHGTLEVGKAADFALWRVGDLAELSYWLQTGRLCAGIVKGGRSVPFQPAIR